MKLLTILIILLALPFGLATEAEPLRPSITFDLDIGLDNSEFRQGPTSPSESDFDYNYNRLSFLVELPASQYSVFRFGLEYISHGFEIQRRVVDAGMFDRGLMYATYNVRLGFKFYLDGE